MSSNLCPRSRERTWRGGSKERSDGEAACRVAWFPSRSTWREAIELTEGADVDRIDEFQGIRILCCNPAPRVTLELLHSRDTAHTCPSWNQELDAKLRVSVDIALKAVRVLALQGAIPEMVCVRDPSLIERSGERPRDAL